MVTSNSKALEKTIFVQLSFLTNPGQCLPSVCPIIILQLPMQCIVPLSQPKTSTADVEITLLLLYLCVSEPYASPDISAKTENCR